MNLLTKPDSKYQPLVVPEAKELGIKHPDKENTWKNESKRRKMSIKATPEHKGQKQFKCDICNAEFISKQRMKGHIAIVHEGKREFICDICNTQFTLLRIVKKSSGRVVGSNPG